MIPKENYEQEQLTIWLDINLYTFSAIRNESDYNNIVKWVKRKREGVRKGIPDFCIILKMEALLFIELKRQKRILKSWKLWASPSRISEEQIKWIEKLNNISNVQCEICYWYKEAIKLIKKIEWTKK